MGKPSYDDATLAAYFQPIDARTLNDPIVGPTLRKLAVDDPDLVLAVADVDRSQIRDALALTPDERLRAASALSATLLELRRGLR